MTGAQTDAIVFVHTARTGYIGKLDDTEEIHALILCNIDALVGPKLEAVYVFFA